MMISIGMPETRRHRRIDTPANLLDYEIVQEQASALGRLGRRLEEALAALRAFDAASATPCARPSTERRERAALVATAGHALWMFVVQREACGLRDSSMVMRCYQVPPEVRDRMGLLP